MSEVDRFVAELAEARIGRCVNPYASEHCRTDLDRVDADRIRAANLADYLRERIGREDLLMLVGEALGYRGCRFSGIPFTSERSLPTDRWSSTAAAGWREPSATIVHGVLDRHGLSERVLLWNAVPLHPAGDGPLTNRTPTAGELRDGLAWLERMLELAKPRKVVAIGRSAQRLLGDEVPVLRHPANGGATLFRSGIAELAASIS